MSIDLDIVFKGGMIATGAGLARLDVGVRGEQIAEINRQIDARRAERVIDAAGKAVLPGAVDVHTHPIYLDDLYGTSVTAAHGGVTTMIHYAYARHGMKPLEACERFKSDGLAKSLLDFGLHCGLLDVEHQMADVPAVFKMGVTSFKIFMAYAKEKWMTDDYWMAALMDVVAAERGLVAVHAENGRATDYLEDKFLREGRSALEMFTGPAPDLLEAEAINRAMSIAHLLGCALYVVHASAAASLEPLRRARALGWKVYGETCPHYLILTEENTASFKALQKMGPPFRTAADNAALWGGLADGTLVTVASDHTPKALKASISDDFSAVPGGSPFVETMMTMIYHEGVNMGRISLPRMVQVMSENPAKMFGLYPRKGTIRAGSDADLVLWDPTCVHTISASTQHSNTDYTLYEGREVTGAPVMTMQRGSVIVENGKLVAQPGRAQFLRTDTSHLYN